jgi:PAS domain S-box-containing protein
MAAAFAAFFLYDIQDGLTVRLSALLILLDTVDVLIAALCLSYAFGGVPRLNSVRALAKFSLFAVVLAPFPRAFFVALETKGNYWLNWTISFLSEAIVYLTLMPAILGWVSHGLARRKKSRVYYLEAAALIAPLAVFAYLAFAAPGRYSSEARLYALVPFLLWSALRFGTTGVSTSAIAIAVLAIWGATHGRGPFIALGPPDNVLSLQLFLFFAAAPFMVLAAVVEENKQASEQHFRSIFDNAQIGISFYRVDGEDFFCNRALQEMLGYTREELSRLEQWDAIVHPEERASGAERFAALLEGRREQDEWEQRFIRRDGRIVIGNGRFSLLRDDTGKPQYVVTLNEDITERRRAEEELHRANLLAETALELTKAGYWQVPLDGSGWYNSSPRRVALFGDIPNPEGRYQIEEVFAHAAEADEAGAQNAREAFDAAVQGNTDTYDTVFAYKRPIDGRIVWAHAVGHVLRDADGNPTDMYGVSQDISEFKRLEAELVTAKEAAEAVTRSKSEFLANMSHELRTPMNAIIGMTHLALKTELTRKQADYLTKVKNAAQSLLGVINDILDFSKIEAGKLDMEMTEFQLENVLNNLSTIVCQKAQDKNLELLIAPQHEIPVNLVGDPLRLGQILVNLVNNAIKFTERGEVLVTVRIEEQFTNRIKLKFAIRDSGIGMTREQSARLFQAFSQADTSTTRKYGGTGLGLSISKRLVELMDGQIWAESQPGVGSTFHFTACFGIGSGEKCKRFIPELAGLRTLVVDDKAEAREILTEALQVFALRAESVSSGEDAIREVAAVDSHDPYRLVLMDWHMPGMGGLEASRIIKRHDRLQNVPKIVMVTAFGREGIRTQAEEIGADGYLLKPVSASRLYDTLVDLFGVAGTGEPAKRDDTREYDVSGIRILLVEDNEVNQQVAIELLESAGAIVTVANDGAEAVRLLTAGDETPSFDLVLMDLQMPDMDGFIATRLLRNDPRLQRLPIIAMTAHALVEERQRCLDAGMNDHVSKPIDPDALFATLARWIKSRTVNWEAMAVRPARDDEEVTVPQIEGVDVPAGLQRVAGNKRLYLDLLSQFVTKQCPAGERIAAAIESGDHSLAERLAHSLKGAAGSIGINQISDSAGKLEGAIRGSHDDITTFVQELSSMLDRQTQAIRGALRVAAPIRAVRGAHQLRDRAETLAAVARLRALLETNDADAPEAFSSLTEILRGTVDADRLSALGTAVREFDFDGALVKLSEITEESWDECDETRMIKVTEKRLVLLVDDQPENIHVVHSILKDEYKIRVAMNGAKALDLAEVEPAPDLILLDVMMPEMDGYEVCSRLKANPNTRDIPVIFLTGRIEVADETRGFNVGAVDYIHKPFSPPIMMSRVRTHLMFCDAHKTVARQLMAINLELEMARQVQLAILPPETPKIPGLEVAARYLPMSSVAGDFYDFIGVDEKHVGILIADVSGHGLPAALIASMLQTALDTQSPHASQPARVLTGLNQALSGKFPSHFVTAAYLFLDLEKRTANYAGAGHPPLLLWRAKSASTAEVLENGLMLGPSPDSVYSEITWPLEGGDRIILFTDGIIEARNPSGEEFGMGRLKKLVEEHHALSAEGFGDAVLDCLGRWSGRARGEGQCDDITLLAVDFQEVIKGALSA